MVVVNETWLPRHGECDLLNALDCTEHQRGPAWVCHRHSHMKVTARKVLRRKDSIVGPFDKTLARKWPQWLEFLGSMASDGACVGGAVRRTLKWFHRSVPDGGSDQPVPVPSANPLGYLWRSYIQAVGIGSVCLNAADAHVCARGLTTSIKCHTCASCAGASRV